MDKTEYNPEYIHVGLLGIPWIYGSVYRFEGQVSVFNYRGGPNYCDLFPEAPPDDLIPSCSEAGVLGVLPGLIGCLQVNEAIKIKYTT